MAEAISSAAAHVLKRRDLPQTIGRVDKHRRAVDLARQCQALLYIAQGVGAGWCGLEKAVASRRLALGVCHHTQAPGTSPYAGGITKTPKSRRSSTSRAKGPGLEGAGSVLVVVGGKKSLASLPSLLCKDLLSCCPGAIPPRDVSRPETNQAGMDDKWYVSKSGGQGVRGLNTTFPLPRSSL
jgi:hypothetical protein